MVNVNDSFLVVLKQHVSAQGFALSDTSAGFTREIAGFSQRIWVESAKSTNGHGFGRVQGRFEFLKEYPSSHEALLSLSYAVHIGGLVRNPSDPSRIQVASSMVFHEDNWRQVAEFFAKVLAMQAPRIVFMGSQLVESLQFGELDRNQLGNYEDDESVLEQLVESVFHQYVQEPSRFDNQALSETAEMLAHPPCIHCNATPETIQLKYPFPRGFAEFSVSVAAAGKYLGNGVTLELNIPTNPGNKLPIYCVEFNELELTTENGMNFLGGWIGSHSGVIHNSEIPNGLYDKSIIESLFADQVRRVIWITSDLLHYDMIANYAQKAEEDISDRLRNAHTPAIAKKKGWFSRLLGG
jgi:hypothetical protein